MQKKKNIATGKILKRKIVFVKIDSLKGISLSFFYNDKYSVDTYSVFRIQYECGNTNLLKSLSFQTF